MQKIEVKKIEKILNYNFKNKTLLEECFLHSSLIRKINLGKKINYVSNFERLEFLGDRVLGLIVAYLIFKEYPNYPEGKMSIKFSFLVQKKFLAKISSDLELHKYIKISRDNKIDIINNKSILSDTLEAIIGAIFIDGGYQKSSKFIVDIWKKFVKDESQKIYDPKTTLQELSQEKSKKLPIYTLVDKKGPPHNPLFIINLSCLNEKNIVGQGSSIRNAEKSAAETFLKKYKKKYEK
tara:strand:+ start:2792 stop:3502 length:711 start_codon:yes stop_codon:yes gene_type:complete